MIYRDLYDNQDLDNKIIIWFTAYNSKYQCFNVINQRIGMDGMSICKSELYNGYTGSIFWKQDMDFPNLFVVKELYAKCTT